MSVILALDVGTKRVGTALSDPLQTIASPYKTFIRAQGKAEKAILNMLTEFSVIKIVAGLPLNENGDKTIQCEDVEDFCRRIERRAKINIEFIDEHLSSIEARERLTASNPSRSIRLDEIDSAAAAVILEDYLRLKR